MNRFLPGFSLEQTLKSRRLQISHNFIFRPGIQPGERRLFKPETVCSDIIKVDITGVEKDGQLITVDWCYDTCRDG